MIDPFGNYLCQKLLEYSTDDQRNLICESVASDLVTISLNMHGTRAVQKMIDFLSTQRQVRPSPNPFAFRTAARAIGFDCLRLACFEHLLFTCVVTLKTLTALSLSLPHSPIHARNFNLLGPLRPLPRTAPAPLSSLPFILG